MNSLTIRAFTAIAMAFFSAESAMAATPLENGGFETGDFSSWTVLSRSSYGYSGGYAAVIPSVDGYQPLEGQYSALLVAKSAIVNTTCAADPWHINCPNPIPIPNAPSGGSTLANPLRGTLGGYAGGVIGQDFYADSGDVLNWSWRFLGEGSDNIFAVITDGQTQLSLNVRGDGSGMTYYNQETASSVVDRRIEYRNADGQGWPRTESLSIPHEGLWTAYFGVEQLADTWIWSGLLLDSVSVNRIAPPVPEPETYAMWGLGFILMFTSLRRRRRM